MRKFKYSKLVRDKIVADILKDKGRRPIFHKLSHQEFIEELKKKLLEETKEIPLVKSKKHLAEELADIQEVIDGLIQALGITKTQLRKLQKAKNLTHGSFKKRLYVDHV